MVKIATTNKKTLLFNGNARSSRIKAALILTGNITSGDNLKDTIMKICISKHSSDAAAVNRYARRITAADKIFLGSIATVNVGKSSGTRKRPCKKRPSTPL